MKQCTVKHKFELQGIGLHTGVNIKITCHPSDIDTGVVFKRIDIDGEPTIPASITHIDSTYRSTCIKKGDVFIHTIEHILSAFLGLGIDNVLVEIDGPEVPILDGSAAPFVKAITESGITEQEKEKEYIEFNKTLEFTDPVSKAEYMYIPSKEGEEYEYTSIIEYNSKVGRQVAVYRPGISYKDEIAPSRTFVFVNELEELADKGAIKGGTVENAIIFGHKDFSSDRVKTLAQKFNVDVDMIVDNGILNGLTLRFQNEPARHKLLDLIGDLYLLRKPIRGKIIAKRPGHTGNVAFAKFLKEEMVKNRRLKGLPIYDPTIEPLFDTEAVKAYIPHRYPFMLVDKIIHLTDKQVVGVKNVTANENFFQGHFPGNPVFPGVLQMEALAQTGGILALTTVDSPDGWDTYFLKMDNVKFKKIVRPGDTLLLKMELLSPIRRGLVHMQGTAYVGESIVSEGELVAQIIKRP